VCVCGVCVLGVCVYDDDLLIVLTETKTSLRLYTRPSGTPPPGKKISKCDDAPAMTLVVQWWLFLPFDTRGRVIFLCRVTFHSAHFTNDRHWDHIPILLQYCGSCPRVRHDPYLPSISASLQTPGRAELATILTIPLLFQGSSPLSFTLSSQRLLEVQKIRL
jgi:hypothetical protein